MIIKVGLWKTLTQREKIVMLQIESDYNYLTMIYK